MNRLTMKLPWPAPGLFPNAARPLHWTEQRRLAREYRKACWAEAISWGANRFKAETLHVHLEFYPPDRRKRDADGMIAAFKAGQDGVADAVKVDDGDWRVSYAFPRETGGYIVAVLSDEPVVISVPLEGVIR